MSYQAKGLGDRPQEFSPRDNLLERLRAGRARVVKSLRKSLHSIVFHVFVVILTHPLIVLLCNDAAPPATSYETSIDYDSEDFTGLHIAGATHCINKGHDFVISLTTTASPRQIRGVSCGDFGKKGL